MTAEDEQLLAYLADLRSNAAEDHRIELACVFDDVIARIRELSAEVERWKSSANHHRDLGITLLDAKWLDPECHRGCKSLIWKKERDMAIEETHRWSKAEKKTKLEHEEELRRVKAERDRLTADCLLYSAFRQGVLRVLGLGATPPRSREEDNRLVDRIDALKAERDRLAGEAEELRKFARDCRDGFDCDTGANGSHPHYCRACCAESALAQAGQGSSKEK